MHAVVVSAGECPAAGTAKRRSLLTAADLTIAADAGLVHCVDHGVWPDVLVGDLDSAPAGLVTQAVAHSTETVAHPVDKDHTDLELAVNEAIRRGAAELTVIGALGGRFDHELASVSMLANPVYAQTRIVIDDGVQRAHVVHAAISLSLAVGTTVSLVPVGGAVQGVHATGVKWPLQAATLQAHTTLGVSNVATEPTQQISVASGVLLVVTSGSH